MRLFSRIVSYLGWIFSIYLLYKNFVLKQENQHFQLTLEKRFIPEDENNNFNDDDLKTSDSISSSTEHVPNSIFQDQFHSQKPISSAINSLLNRQQHLSSSNSDIISPKSHKSEYHVYPFSHFSLYHIEMLESNLKRHPRDVFKENPHRARDLLNIVQTTARSINSQITDFQEGYTRFKQDSGTEYILFFKSNGKTVIKHIFKPFENAVEVQKSPYNTEKDDTEIIHFIVPFAADGETDGHSGHIHKLQDFLINFKEAVEKDKNVFLTLVWVTEKSNPEISTKKQIEAIMHDLVTSSKAEIITVTGKKFARGLALDHGIKYGKNLNSDNNNSRLLFFCDIDVFFQLQFLNTCRRSAIENRVVFYPVVFSLYNPAIVWHSLGKNNGNSAKKDRTKLRRVHKDHGFWRDFGFGMSCQYESDYSK